MPSRIPDPLKSLVIQQWLAGTQRDRIAVANGLSAGAVTNIVNEWRQSLGLYVAETLRDLAVTLKKIGLSPAQCAVGFRVAMMLNRLGVRDDEFESFISDIYNRCSNKSIKPEAIATYIADLLEFSYTVPFSQISSYISQKGQEKKELEKEIDKLQNEIQILQTQKSDSERLSSAALADYEFTKDRLRWYSDIKEELEKQYGMPVNDISKLASIVNKVSTLFNFDVHRVVYELSNLESVRTRYEEYLTSISEVSTRYHTLDQKCSDLEQRVNSYNQSLSVYGELESLTFGLKELKLLRQTIREIADANNIPQQEAVRKFFSDIEEQYDDKLGFESKIGNLRQELNNLKQENLRLRMQVNAIPTVGANIIKILDMNDMNSDSNNSNNNRFDKVQLLVDKVRKCGGIEAVINQLSSPAPQIKEKEEENDRRKELEVESKNITKEPKEEEEEEEAIPELSQPVQMGEEGRERLEKENSKNITKEPKKEKEESIEDIIVNAVRKNQCLSAEESSEISSAVDNWEEREQAGKE